MSLFGHSGACGDLICSLPTIRELGGGVLRVGRKEFRQFNWYDGLIPQLRTLLTTQPYVLDVLEWNLEPVDFNMDDFRLNVRSNPNLPLVLCHAVCFGVQVDLSKPWIEVSPKFESEIIISRSTRFHDGYFDWKPLVKYADRCSFIGFPEEFEEFKRISGIKIKYLDQYQGERPELFLELAQVIRGSKLFVGNSSFFWTLAEAMKVNRVMDVFHGYPNCLPQTANGWTELKTDIIERCLGEQNG